MTNGKKYLNMLNPQTDTEWMDGFLQGQLSTTEMVIFQERLGRDPDFSALFEEQKLLVDGLRLARMSEQVRYFQGLNVLAEGEEILELEEEEIGEAVRLDRNLDVLARFKERGEELDSVVELPKRRTWNWQLAASLLLPFGLILGLWSAYLGNQLPEKAYVNFPVAGTMGNEPATEGFLLYKEGKYEEALIALNKTNQENSLYAEAQALQGEILFKQQKAYPKAYQKFNNLLAQKNLLAQQNQDFRERLEWNTLLAAKKIDINSIDLLDNILANPRHKFHQNAKKIKQQTRFYNYFKWAAFLSLIIGIIGFIFWLSNRESKATK